MSTMFWIFLGVFLLSVGSAVVTARLRFLAFAPGALLGFFLTLFPAVEIWAQWIVFFSVSIVFSLYLCFFHRKKPLTALEAMIRRRCIVTEEIDTLGVRGQVELDGMLFAARALGGRAYAPGTALTVVAIEGVKLICG